jgi:hypothetical protein
MAFVSTEPSGAVAIWHDIEPEGLPEFYAWHGEEHMPERVAIPGFVRGRRFQAIEADRGFFNIYETDRFSAVTGPDYQARLDAPTPRTLSAVRHFRKVARSLCRVETQIGAGQGGVMATLRYDVERGREEAHVAEMASKVLPALAAEPGIASVRLLVADPGASGYVNAEQRARGAANLIPPFVLVAESWAESEPFMALLRARFDDAACSRLGLTGERSLGFYRHQLTVAR